MLTKIAIENFKSIGGRIEIELKPLTIFVGPNASGKSSILEALPLLVQSIGHLLSKKSEFRKYQIEVLTPEEYVTVKSKRR